MLVHRAAPAASKGGPTNGPTKRLGGVALSFCFRGRGSRQVGHRAMPDSSISARQEGWYLYEHVAHPDVALAPPSRQIGHVESSSSGHACVGWTIIPTGGSGGKGHDLRPPRGALLSAVRRVLLLLAAYDYLAAL